MCSANVKLHWQFLLTSLHFLTFHLFMTVIFSCKFFFSPKCAFDGPGWLMFAVMEKCFLVQTSKWGQRALHAQSCCMPWACQCLRHCRQKPKSPTAFQGACLDADRPQCEKADSGRCLKSVGGTKPKWPFLQLDCFQSALPLVSSPQRKAVQLEGSRCNDAEWENPGLDCAFKIWQRAFYQLCLWSRVQRGKAVQLKVRKIALHVP